MNTKRTPAAIIDALSGFLSLAWFFLPVTAGPSGSGILLSPFTMPLRFAALAPSYMPGLFLYQIGRAHV